MEPFQKINGQQTIQRRQRSPLECDGRKFKKPNSKSKDVTKNVVTKTG